MRIAAEHPLLGLPSHLLDALQHVFELFPQAFPPYVLLHFRGEAPCLCHHATADSEQLAIQLAALFRFRGDKIFEERWFVDTEQWKQAL